MITINITEKQAMEILKDLAQLREPSSVTMALYDFIKSKLEKNYGQEKNNDR